MASLFWISLGLSILAPLIFWFEGLTLGLNFFVYTVLFALGLVYLLKKFGKIRNTKAVYLLIPIILLSSTFFIFYNRFFNRWNLIVIPFLTLFMIQWMISGKFSFNIGTIARCFEMVFIPLDQIFDSSSEIGKALKRNKVQEVQAEKKSKKRFILPLIITLIVVFFVAVILASADDDFARLFGTLLDAIIDFIKSIKLWRLILRAAVACVIYFYLSSFFYTYCCVYEVKEKEEKGFVDRDLLTIKMVMGGLNILYLLFAIIQFKALLFPDAGIEYSKYAREGFFQLIGISLLNLILIIYTTKRKHNENETEVTVIKALNILMVLFTFIILLSSAFKMYFCIDEFGYTVHRLIVWSALIEEFVLIIPTSMFITNEKINLNKYYFLSIFIVYLVMNFSNFEYIVSKNNIDRYYATGKLDVEYLERYTGTDAVKPMLRIVEEANAKDTAYTKTKEEISKYLRYINQESVGEIDFREFNISKYRARKMTDDLVEQYLQEGENKTRIRRKGL